MTPQALYSTVLLVVYLLVMVALAAYGRSKTRGVSDYYIGGRSLGGVALGLSFFATYASTNSYLGFSGKAYTHGVAWLLLVPFAVGLSLLAWVFVAPALRRMTGSSSSLTLPELLGHRFDSRAVRTTSALIVLVASVLYMTAVYKGIGNLFESLLGLSYPQAIGLVLVIVVLYTSVGGFHSVVRTDVVQALLMIVAAVLLHATLVRAAGGYGSLQALGDSESTARLLATDTAMPLSLLLGVLFATTVKFVVEPRQLSRFFALSDPREARKGVVVSSLAFLVVFSLLAPLGLFAHRLQLSVEDSDRVIPELLARPELFSPLVASLLLLAMLSAAMSSLDSVLLVLASSFQRDLVESLLESRAKDSQRIRATRVAVVVFALITAAVALRPPAGIVELTAFSGALYGACFLPAVLLGLHWRRGTAAGVLASIAAGIGVLLGWPRLSWAETVHPVFPAIAASTLAYGSIALASRRSYTLELPEGE
ncbi:MAG: sodium/solute symporter [Acidobacteriota bacterium]